MSLAGRTVFQMGQTTSAHQEVLWPFSQRREDANLDRHLRLRAHIARPQAIGTGTQPLPDFTNSQPDFVRESPTFTGPFAILLARPNINVLQPTGSIPVITGQFWLFANCYSASWPRRRPSLSRFR